MGECSWLPEERVRDMIEKSEETGNETGFSFCFVGDGDERIQEGSEDGIRMPDPGCDVFAHVHVHPNDVLRLSGDDRTALKESNADAICVSDTDGNVLCETEDGDRCRFELDD